MNTPGTLDGPITRVMVGRIFSRPASKAVGWATDFAERFGAELHLVQVIVPSNPVDTEFGNAERTRAAAASESLLVEARRLDQQGLGRRRGPVGLFVAELGVDRVARHDHLDQMELRTMTPRSSWPTPAALDTVSGEDACRP